MDGLGIALVIVGLILVCGGLIFPRGLEKPNEESMALAEFEHSQIGRLLQGEAEGVPPHVGDPFERHLLEDLNATDPEVRNERG